MTEPEPFDLPADWPVGTSAAARAIPRRRPRTHACPCRCGAEVADRLFCCPAGWRRLPRPQQLAITDPPRGSAEHGRAMGEAARWLRDHPPARRR
jgi:hypothetical protein